MSGWGAGVSRREGGGGVSRRGEGGEQEWGWGEQGEGGGGEQGGGGGRGCGCHWVGVWSAGVVGGRDVIRCRETQTVARAGRQAGRRRPATDRG